MPRLPESRRRGFGLLGIEDRARLAGGRATIRSPPGHGTIVTAIVPVPVVAPPAPPQAAPGADVPFRPAQPQCRVVQREQVGEAVRVEMTFVTSVVG